MKISWCLSVIALQLMCNGAQVHALICQLQAQALSCSDHCSGAERVFAHEDENLSIEPVLLAQCVAHSVSVSRDTYKDALAQHVQLHALPYAPASGLHCLGLRLSCRVSTATKRNPLRR